MKNMNKKFLIFGVLGIFALAVVSAIAYYGFFTQSFTVVSAISISECDDVIEGNYFTGDIIEGKVCNITNYADTERVIEITNDADENISVSYWAGLELTKKSVDFTSNNWDVLENKSHVNFVMVGNEFNAVVPDDDKKEGYVLIYYKDNSDRFNSPAKAILIEDVEGNLPYEDDKNADEYEYCIDEENYLSCHGAKIWYVPSNAINEDDTLDWSRASEFYFETNLIQYNSAGIITIYKNVVNPLVPYYTINNFAEESTYTITTTIA